MDDADRAHDGTAGALPEFSAIQRANWKVTEQRNGPYFIRRAPGGWLPCLGDSPIDTVIPFPELAFTACELHSAKNHTS